MNLETILQDLQKHIDDNPALTKTALAEKIGVGRSELVQWLDKDYGKKPTADKAFKILNYLNSLRKIPMNTQQTSNDEGVELINNAMIRKYRNAERNIKSFQSTRNDGWVPSEGGTEPDYADNVAELVKAGRYDEARDLLDQIQSGPRVTPSTATKASVNRGGSTKLPQNASDAGFSQKLNALKKEMGMRQDAAVKATRKDPNKKIEFTGDLSAKTVDIAKVKELHTARLESTFNAPEGSVLHAKKIEEKLLSNRNNKNFEKMMSLRANLNQFAI